MFSSETLRISMPVHPCIRPTAVDDFARLTGRVFRDVLQLVEMRMGLGRNVTSDKCERESGPKWFPPPPTLHSSTWLLFVRYSWLCWEFCFSENDDLSRCFRFYYVNPVQMGISLRDSDSTRKGPVWFSFDQTTDGARSSRHSSPPSTRRISPMHVH